MGHQIFQIHLLLISSYSYYYLDCIIEDDNETLQPKTKFIETAKNFEIESLTNNESVFNNPSCEDNSLQEMDLISSDSNQEKLGSNKNSDR